MANPVTFLLRAALKKQLVIENIELLPTHGPFIIAGNHQGFLDAPILSYVVQKHTGQTPLFPTTSWVWKRYKKMLGARGAQSLGMLPVLDDKPGAVLEACVQQLKQGGVIGIFPEGKRNAEMQLRTGKTGAARLALSSGAPIVPAGIFAGPGGATDALKEVLQKTPLRIRLGAPIHFTASMENITREELHRLTDECMRAIAALSAKEYQRQ